MFNGACEIKRCKEIATITYSAGDNTHYICKECSGRNASFLKDESNYKNSNTKAKIPSKRKKKPRAEVIVSKKLFSETLF